MTMREKIGRAVTRAMLTGKPISDAVLDAMREPTETMMSAAMDGDEDDFATKAAYQRMIDAAKEER